MKINKNVLSLLMLLALNEPIRSNEEPEDINKLTNLQESVITQIINTAIETIADQFQAMQVHTISQQTAVEILHAFANSLVPGSCFELNDIRYQIAYPTKTIATDDQDATDNQDSKE